jgi:hypothetical protein
MLGDRLAHRNFVSLIPAALGSAGRIYVLKNCITTPIQPLRCITPDVLIDSIWQFMLAQQRLSSRVIVTNSSELVNISDQLTLLEVETANLS